MFSRQTENECGLPSKNWIDLTGEVTRKQHKYSVIQSRQLNNVKIHIILYIPSFASQFIPSQNSRCFFKIFCFPASLSLSGVESDYPQTGRLWTLPAHSLTPSVRPSL